MDFYKFAENHTFSCKIDNNVRPLSFDYTDN